MPLVMPSPNVTPTTPPNFTPIASMMNMANSAQQLQLGNMAIQQKAQTLPYDVAKAQADSQQSTIPLEERKAVAPILANLQSYSDENGNPDYNRLIPDVMKAAPTTGSQYIQNIATAATSATNAKSALNKLTDEQRQQVGQMIGQIDPKNPGPGLQAISAMSDVNPGLKPLVQHAFQYVLAPALAADQQSGGNGQNFKQAQLGVIKSILPATAQAGVETPTFVNTGGTLQPTNPFTPGQPALATTLSPESRQTLTTDAAGNPVIVNKTSAGVISPTGGGSGAIQDPGTTAQPTVPNAGPSGGASEQQTPAQPFPGWMNRPQAETQAGAATEIQNVRQRADNAMTVRNLNDQILGLTKDTKTGFGAGAWQHVLSAVGATVGGSPAANYEILNKYLAQKNAEALQAMGMGGTDARQAMVMQGTGSTEYSPQALAEVTKYTDSLNTGLKAYREGLDKAVGTGPNQNAGNLLPFKSAWAQNADPLVFRLMDDMRRGDQEDITKLKQGMTKPQLDALAVKFNNLKSLSTTGRLPNVQ